MLMQNFGVTNKEHYGMLWYFLEWSITTALKITNYEPGVDPKGGVVQLYDGLGG